VSESSEEQKRPLGDVFASALENARALLRLHAELARIEVGEAIAVRARGAGLMSAAPVLGLFGLGFAAAAGSSALSLILPAWAANLIVSALFLVTGGVLILAGRRLIRTAPPSTQRTQDTLKEDARWAKQRLEK
jgi:hypothetical protein